MSKARPNNRRVFRNRPAIKYHSQFHNVIGSVMRNRSGWIKANEEDEKKLISFGLKHYLCTNNLIIFISQST